jgi:probable HAF family extracellular repeat protein
VAAMVLPTEIRYDLNLTLRIDGDWFAAIIAVLFVSIDAGRLAVIATRGQTSFCLRQSHLLQRSTAQGRGFFFSTHDNEKRSWVMSAKRFGLIAKLAMVVLVTASPEVSYATTIFEGLGFLPGDTYSYPTAVNAHGSVVVGTSSSSVSGQAFRWTKAGGMVGLGYLPGNSQSFSAAVNANGLVVVGNSGVPPQAIRWTDASGLTGLGYLSGNNSSAAVGVSAHGSVVVGNSYTSGNCCNNQAFRWTVAGGMVGLGSVSGYPVSYAAGVNAYGSVVVGVSYVASLSQNQAFRWTAVGGMVELGYLLGGKNSFANAVNADGSVVVGGSTTANNVHNYEAFRWTAAGGMVGLGYLSGDNFSDPNAVNANGSVVVGCSGLNGNCDQAFLWTAADGMKSVQALLTAKGVSTTGWTLTSAQGVSADGQVIVGSGVDPNGRTQGWIARLGPPCKDVGLRSC